MGLAVGTAKYLLFIFNFIFFVTGIAIIAVGGVFLSEVNTIKDIDSGLSSPAVFLIVVGVFVALISFFGCCGAIKHSYCMLVTFAVILALIFILELAAGILAYVKRDNLVNSLEDSFKKSINSSDPEKQKWWDNWQETEHCCGVKNASDWGDNIPSSCCNGSSITTLPSIVTDSTVISSTLVTTLTPKPKREASDSDSDSKSKCNSSDAYREGCLTQLEDFVEKKIVVIGGVGVGIAFVQILGIVYACCLASAVKQ